MLLNLAVLNCTNNKYSHTFYDIISDETCYIFCVNHFPLNLEHDDYDFYILIYTVYI